MTNEQLELKKLSDICHQNLKSSKECLDYLNSRGLNEAIINKYRIGYFPRNINILKKYVDESVLLKYSIMNYSGNSLFSEYYYLVFPILTEYNENIGIAGRLLLSDPERKALEFSKYKNSTYKKSNYLYGLEHSRSSILKNQNVFVVEGHFDHISLTNNNINNSVAICGTAFSKNHFIKLARYTDKITFILDHDSAGESSMLRIYNKYINNGIKIRLMTLPDGCKDIDEYFSHGGNQTSFYNDLKQYNPDIL